MTGWRLGLTAGVTSAPQPDVPGPRHATLASLYSKSLLRTPEQGHGRSAWPGGAPRGSSSGVRPPGPARPSRGLQASLLLAIKPRALLEACPWNSVGPQLWGAAAQPGHFPAAPGPQAPLLRWLPVTSLSTSLCHLFTYSGHGGAPGEGDRCCVLLHGAHAEGGVTGQGQSPDSTGATPTPGGPGKGWAELRRHWGHRPLLLAALGISGGKGHSTQPPLSCPRDSARTRPSPCAPGSSPGDSLDLGLGHLASTP